MGTNSALQRKTREMVQKRYFFHVSGFDPYDLASLYRRFVRETVRFAATWNVTAAVSALREPGAQAAGAEDELCDGHWTVTTSAPGWQVRTRYEQLDWSDIVRAELGRPAGRLLRDGAVTFADLIASGTA